MTDARVGGIVRRAEGLLDGFNAWERRFPRFVESLELYISQLDGIADPSIVDELQSEWWHLEAISASMLEAHRTTLTADECVRAERGVLKLKAELKKLDIPDEQVPG